MKLNYFLCLGGVILFDMCDGDIVGLGGLDGVVVL